MNNKTIIELGFRIKRRIMEILDPVYMEWGTPV